MGVRTLPRVERKLYWGNAEELWSNYGDVVQTKPVAGVTRSSRVLAFVFIAYAIHRANDLIGGTNGAEFLAQVFNMTIYRAVADGTEIRIERLHQLATREHPFGMRQEGA